MVVAFVSALITTYNTKQEPTGGRGWMGGREGGSSDERE